MSSRHTDGRTWSSASSYRSVVVRSHLPPSARRFLFTVKSFLEMRGETHHRTENCLGGEYTKESVVSWLGKLERAIAARSADSWRPPLERLHGKIGDDGIERITTQTVFDILEIPQRNRGAGACRRLAKLMAELGWTAVRVRGLTRGGYREQVRGYARDARNKHRFQDD
jgi:hypothetical protein